MPCGNWDSERARARLVLTPGMIPSQTCMIPLKAHSTPLFCCATPRSPQKPFAGKESKDFLCPGALPVQGLPRPPMARAPPVLGLPVSQGSPCPRTPPVPGLPMSQGSPVLGLPVSQDSWPAGGRPSEKYSVLLPPPGKSQAGWCK